MLKINGITKCIAIPCIESPDEVPSVNRLFLEKILIRLVVVPVTPSDEMSPCCLGSWTIISMVRFRLYAPIIDAVHLKILTVLPISIDLRTMQSTVKKTISAYVTLNCLVVLTRFRRTLNFKDKRTDSVCSAGAFSSLTIRYFCSSKNLGLLSARFPLMINFRSAAGFDLREVQFRFSISPILTFRSYPWIWGPPRGSSAKYHINVTHRWFVSGQMLK